MPAHGQGFDTTEGYRRLDVRELSRAGILWPGLSSGWHWWRHGCARFSIATIATEDCLWLDYKTSDGQGFCYPISLERTACTFGGSRPWFLCPQCSRRVALLHLGLHGRFACRHCLRLNFKSQRESRSDRLLRKAEKIRQRLGWQPGIGNPDGFKPRGMTWRRYWRLADEHDRLANCVMGGWSRSLERLHKRL